jgi:hypothetical protein
MNVHQQEVIPLVMMAEEQRLLQQKTQEARNRAQQFQIRL